MPLTGPTPADWIANKDQRRDEQMRMMMQMALASKQFQQEQQRYQSNLEHQNFMESEQMRRNDIYERNVNRMENPQTEMQRNYDWLLKNDPNAAKSYIEKQVNPASENFEFDLDDWTAGDMEKTLGMPPGTAKNMHPRQRQMAFSSYQSTKNPRPDTSIQQWQTTQGRQQAAIDEALRRYEARYGKVVTDENDMIQKEITPPAGLTKAKGDLGRTVASLQQYRDMVAERELSPTEWNAYMAISAGQETAPGGEVDPIDEAANELAREYGFPPELFKQWYQKNFGQKKGAAPAPAGGPNAGLRER